MLVVRQPRESHPFEVLGDTVLESPTFTIRVGPLRGAGPLPSDDSLLLAFDAHVRIDIDGRVWFDEPDLPVLELAVAVYTWLRTGGNLQFDSMEADESPFLAIERYNGGCRLTAAWQSYDESRLIPAQFVEAAFSDFAVGVFEVVHSRFGVDVSHLGDGLPN